MSTASSLPPKARPQRKDLREILLQAAYGAAQRGGPEAVGLREVTRQAGVVPNAAYRHFKSRDDLLAAVRMRAQTALSTALDASLASLDPSTMKRKAFARESLRLATHAYLDFAMSEPGLFRAAFVPLTGPANPDAPTPFHSAIARMIEADLVPAKRRRATEILVWAEVHGLATLIAGGLIAREVSSDVGEQLVEIVERL
jgi:AcrR family transcriptional regulator